VARAATHRVLLNRIGARVIRRPRPGPSRNGRAGRRPASSASVFFLSVLHALHESVGKMRSFVFIERISEDTDVFDRERDFRAVSEAIARDAGVADVSGYTDYRRPTNSTAKFRVLDDEPV